MVDIYTNSKYDKLLDTFIQIPDLLMILFSHCSIHHLRNPLRVFFGGGGLGEHM